MDDVRASLAQIEKLRGEPFTPQEIEEITSGFVAFRSSQALSWQDAQATDHFAYTVHFHSRPWYDPDLWFEYKWNAGGRRQSYRIVVYDWVIYRHLRACYKNGLANWTWLEGRDQRVTLVIGLCGYAPYGPAAGNILRSVVRIVT